MTDQHKMSTAITPWKKEETFMEYTKTISLWRRTTTLPLEKQVPHILLNGINPNHKSIGTYSLGAPEEYWSVDKDPHYVNDGLDGNVVEGIRTKDPYERLQEMVCDVTAENPVLVQADVAADILRFDRQKHESYSQALVRFREVYGECIARNDLPGQRELCQSLFRGMHWRDESDQSKVTDKFDLSQAGKKGHLIGDLTKAIARIWPLPRQEKAAPKTTPRTAPHHQYDPDGDAVMSYIGRQVVSQLKGWRGGHKGPKGPKGKGKDYKGRGKTSKKGAKGKGKTGYQRPYYSKASSGKYIGWHIEPFFSA